MSKTLDRAVTYVVAEHLADSLAGLRVPDGKCGTLAITKVSQPIVVAALRHYVKCLKAEGEG